MVGGMTDQKIVNILKAKRAIAFRNAAEMLEAYCFAERPKR